jgi:hypothetical protein
MTPESADIQPVGAGLSRDISKGEAVEAGLEAFITRRHDYRVAKEGHRPSEEMYEESTKRYQEQMHATARVEWHLHHVSQAERLKRTLEALVEYREEQASELMDTQPEGAA